MLAWAIPITGEGIGGGQPPSGERPDNSLPPWLSGGGGGAGAGGGRPEISLPIVLPPSGVTLPEGPEVPPGVNPPKPPDGGGDWMIVYTPDGGWKFIRAGDLLEAIKVPSAAAQNQINLLLRRGNISRLFVFPLEFRFIRWCTAEGALPPFAIM